MSATVIGGISASDQATGVVTIPIKNLSILQALGLSPQSYLASLSASVTSGSAGLTNIDTVAGTTFQTGQPDIFEITNTDSTGSITTGSITGTATIPTISGSNNGHAAVVQAPGNFTVRGTSTNLDYILSANSNVSLSAGGGLQTNSDAVYAGGGSDTVDLHQSGGSVLVSGGFTIARVYSGQQDLVAAVGSASVRAGVRTGYTGSFAFENFGSAAGTVLGGAGTDTALGGNTGGLGFYSGGTAGSNLLAVGTGSAFLVGGGSNDTLMAGYGMSTATGGMSAVASSAKGPDYLFAGAGNETLLASSATGSNLFAAGSGADVISTNGSGNQNFFGGVGSATMTGSTQAGAHNIFFFGGANGSGGNEIITDFNKSRDSLYVLGGHTIESITGASYNGFSYTSSRLTLSDNTNVLLLNVTPSAISGALGGTQITTATTGTLHSGAGSHG